MKIFHVALATFFLSALHAQDTLTWQQFNKINKVKELVPLERIPQSFANDYKVIGYAAHIQCQGQNDGYLQEVYSHYCPVVEKPKITKSLKIEGLHGVL